MTFLNTAVLAALAAVAIPILIHLLHRRKAQVLDWGAMRFLLESLAARSRHILLEEMLLMALRCALIALVVLAAARPFVPADSRVPWAVVLPAALAGAVCLGLGAVAWAHRWAALALLAAGVLLLGGAGVGTAYEYAYGQKGAGTGEARDLALIVDGSMSMSVKVEGRSNFDRALDAARRVVDSARSGDAICVILAGSMPQASTAAPVSGRDEARAAIGALRPTNGPMGLIEALNFAVAALARGQDPARKIVLITDGQDVGWDLHNEARWQFLASALAQLPGTTELVVRMVPLPQSTDNRAIADISFSRNVVGTDRPVSVAVKVVNPGTVPGQPTDVELTVDDRVLPARRVGRVAAGAAETVSVDHQFDRPGRHVVSARLVATDDLPGDDDAVRVLDVQDVLPALVVEGAPSLRPLDSEAAFLEVALAPARGATAPQGVGDMIVPTVIAAADIGTVSDLSPYRLVVLADVPRLPDATARLLRQFVRDGGGLLVAPGERAVPEFYNHWTIAGSQPVAPAMLAERASDPNAPVRLALKGFTHPALALVADTAQSDAEQALVNGYWKLVVDAADPSVRVGGLMDNHDPFLVERKIEKGYVLMTAVSLGRRDTNLPTLKCFVPLAHELAYFLAAPTLVPTNIRPGAQAAAEVPFEPGLDLTSPAGPGVRAMGPGGTSNPAAVSTGRSGYLLTYAGTGEPGLYRFVVPPPASGGEERSVPFVVVRDPQESFLTPVEPSELGAAQRHIALKVAASDDDLVALLQGDVPGKEIWRRLALCALLVLVAEVALARWITARRTVQTVNEVPFAEEAPETQGVRLRFMQRAGGGRRGPTGDS